MDFDRIMLLAFGLIFAALSLVLAARALHIRRSAPVGGVEARPMPAEARVTLLAMPLAAAAFLGYYAVGGDDLGAVVWPFLLVVFGFPLIVWLRTGRLASLAGKAGGDRHARRLDLGIRLFMVLLALFMMAERHLPG